MVEGRSKFIFFLVCRFCAGFPSSSLPLRISFKLSSRFSIAEYSELNSSLTLCCCQDYDYALEQPPQRQARPPSRGGGGNSRGQPQSGGRGQEARTETTTEQVAILKQINE